MKNIFLQFLLFFTFFVYSQGDPGADPKSAQNFIIKGSKIIFLPDTNINSETWINDSICMFSKKNIEWEKFIIDKVVNRDNQGRILNSIRQIFDDTLNIWQTIKANYITYYEDNKINEFLSKKWSYALNSLEDTTVYEKFDKNNNLETLIYHFDGTSMTDGDFPRTKEVNFFNNQNKIKTKLIYYYNEYHNKWEFGIKKSYNYDSTGKIIEMTLYKYSLKNNTWNKSSKANYFYNDKGYLSEEEWYIYKEDFWKNKLHYSYKYDENGFIIEEVKKTWYNYVNDWIFNYKNQFKNDSNGNIIFLLNQSWKTNTNSWVNIRQSFRKYDSLGNKIYAKSQFWKNDTKEWENTIKLTYFYNDKGQMTEAFVYHWHKGDKVWINFTKTIYTYNQNDDIQSILIKGWDSENNTWKNSEKVSYIYNSNNLKTQEIQSKRKGEWIETFKIIYYWNVINTTNTTKLDEDIAIYISPNPAKDFITINGFNTDNNTDLYFWSEEGNLLLSKNINTSSKISIESLPAGIYFLQISDKNRIVFKKLIKN